MKALWGLSALAHYRHCTAKIYTCNIRSAIALPCYVHSGLTGLCAFYGQVEFYEHDCELLAKKVVFGN